MILYVTEKDIKSKLYTQCFKQYNLIILFEMTY